MNSNLNLLVVEDSIINARGMEHKLRQLGYQHIHLVRTSSECMELLETQSIDLILMDIELQGSDVDGIETARVVQEKHDVPVIFVTAYTDPVTLTRAGALEPANYLVKPVSERQLYVAIQQALSRQYPLVDLRSLTLPTGYNSPGAIFVKSNEKYYERVEISDIISIETGDNGVCIYTLTGKHFTYNTLSSLLEILKGKSIVQVHKSLAINTDHVVAKSETEVVLRNGATHVIGKAYKDTLDGHFRILRPKS